jgi:hypothetical protein
LLKVASFEEIVPDGQSVGDGLRSVIVIEQPFAHPMIHFPTKTDKTGPVQFCRFMKTNRLNLIFLKI